MSIDLSAVRSLYVESMFENATSAPTVADYEREYAEFDQAVREHVAAELERVADKLHKDSGIGNMFGGYDCTCGETWRYPMLTLGCVQRADLYKEADKIRKGE